MTEYVETCCCGARIEIAKTGYVGDRFPLLDFRAAHAECRKAYANGCHPAGQRWVEAECSELPELEPQD